MRPFALGVDFRRASQPMRDLLADLPHPALPPGCGEALWLIAPDRVELHGTANDPLGPLMVWQELGAPEPYIHWDRAALRHLARVTAGLESPLTGDPSMPDHVKAAARTASAHGAFGSDLGQRVMMALGIAHQARTVGGLADYPKRIGIQAVTAAQRLHGGLKQASLLVIGEAAETLAKPFVEAGVGSIFTLARDGEFALRLGGQAVPPEPLADSLARGDIVVTGLSLGRPVIEAEDLRTALKVRRRRPILLIDGGLPADVAPDAAEFDDIFTYTLADLADMAYQDGASVLTQAASLIDKLVASAEGESAVLGALDALIDAQRVAALTRHPRDADKATRDFADRLLNRLRASLGPKADPALGQAAQQLFGLMDDFDKDSER
ncbi:hypothetical protein ACFSM5_21540 [Lacibacterium aquatile]|uniref:Glutamyl-tRNA reductase n=1 Tax=Lacibacterium aquatile TaxID=1168082 RepID=A0ABW5DY87_9PROT